MARQSFRLTNPRVTVPAIEEAFGRSGEDRAYVANLLLAVDPAIGGRLGRDYAAMLRAMVVEGN